MMNQGEWTSERNQRSKKDHSRMCWKDQEHEREDPQDYRVEKWERKREREITGIENNGYQLSNTWEKPVKSAREWKVCSSMKKQKQWWTACFYSTNYHYYIQISRWTLIRTEDNCPQLKFFWRCERPSITTFERKTCPYHCSLHLFTMVRRSSYGPIVCWIFA